MSSVIKDLVNKFSNTSNTEDSSNHENVQAAKADDSREVPVSEEPTRHAETKPEEKAAKPQAPISADSAPNESRSKEEEEEASKNGAPAHLVPNSEHYHASSNVQHILDDAEKADEAHRPEEAAASEAKEQEAAPEKPDKATGPGEGKMGAPPASNSDEPAETTTQSGYKPSNNVEHIIDDAEKADEKHRPEEHATDQDEEAKKMDNPTAGATNASHPHSDEPAVSKAEKSKIEDPNNDGPGNTTSKSGYTASDHVKQIIADAEKADDAKRADEHKTDREHHKDLDQPTAHMSVHEKSREES